MSKLKKILNRGENLIEILKQNLHVPLTTIEQVLSIYLGVGYSGGWLYDVSKIKSKKMVVLIYTVAYVLELRG